MNVSVVLLETIDESTHFTLSHPEIEADGLAVFVPTGKQNELSDGEGEGATEDL
jgi:hypothetical protein